MQQDPAASISSNAHHHKTADYLNPLRAAGFFILGADAADTRAAMIQKLALVGNISQISIKSACTTKAARKPIAARPIILWPGAAVRSFDNCHAALPNRQ